MTPDPGNLNLLMASGNVVGLVEALLAIMDGMPPGSPPPEGTMLRLRAAVKEWQRICDGSKTEEP
jgi:hypothetical protein